MAKFYGVEDHVLAELKKAVEDLGLKYVDGGGCAWVTIPAKHEGLGGAEAQIVKMKRDRGRLKVEVVGGDDFTRQSSQESGIQAQDARDLARKLKGVLESRRLGSSDDEEKGTWSKMKQAVGLGETVTETEVRQLARRELADQHLSEEVSGARWGILAPESADFEVLRYAEGRDDKEAMNNLMDWARNNGFDVDAGSPDASSYWDYRFERGGNSLAPTKLQ